MGVLAAASPQTPPSVMFTLPLSQADYFIALITLVLTGAGMAFVVISIFNWITVNRHVERVAKKYAQEALQSFEKRLQATNAVYMQHLINIQTIEDPLEFQQAVEELLGQDIPLMNAHTFVAQKYLEPIVGRRLAPYVPAPMKRTDAEDRADVNLALDALSRAQADPLSHDQPEVAQWLAVASALTREPVSALRHLRSTSSGGRRRLQKWLDLFWGMAPPEFIDDLQVLPEIFDVPLVQVDNLVNLCPPVEKVAGKYPTFLGHPLGIPFISIYRTTGRCAKVTMLLFDNDGKPQWNVTSDFHISGESSDVGFRASSPDEVMSRLSERHSLVVPAPGALVNRWFGEPQINYADFADAFQGGL